MSNVKFIKSSKIKFGINAVYKLKIFFIIINFLNECLINYLYLCIFN